MHRRPLNLVAGVISVPKLSKYTSNLLIGSHEVQITIILVKHPACQGDWTLS